MNLLWVLLCTVFAVAAATAGSRVKREIEERQENGWNFEHEGVLETDNGKWKKEEDSHHLQKRVAPAIIAAVVAAGATTLGALATVANAVGSVNRKIAIDIENMGPYQWEPLNTHFVSGTSDQALPRYVPANKAVIYTARKTSGTATGAVGVVSFYMKNEDITLCVLFSVPYDYGLYSNWWNAKIYSGRRPANYNTYVDLYYNLNPFKGNHVWNRKGLGWFYSADGFMNNSGQGVLKVIIKKIGASGK